MTRGNTYRPKALLPPAVLGALAFAGALLADDTPTEKPPPEKEKSGVTKASEEQSSVTHHTGVFGGEEIEYTATAGTLVLRKDDEEPHASVFYTAYTKDGTGDPSQRSLMFCFNGGPGSSSVWLHLGGLGPKRVKMGPEGKQPAPPYQLIDNPESVLAMADLVFIDPVSTGFSRPEKGQKASDFHGYHEDLNSVADFIRLYTTRNARWSSPKFLTGESYGAFRAAGLADVLQERYGMYLNGIVLVSGLLSFETLRGTDLAAISFLPSMTDVAAFHGKLDEELVADRAKLRRKVEAFAKGGYATALLKGGRISQAEKRKAADRLAAYTGLDSELIERLDLRIGPSRFRKELLRDEGMVIGRFDGRLTARDGDRAGTYPRLDPSDAAVSGAYSAMMKDYLRRTLKFESDLVYEILTGKVHPWNYKPFTGSYVDVSPRLASAMTRNPDLKVFVACGIHDLATPYFGIRHSVDHLGVDPVLLGNIDFVYYEGGHMMYTIDASNDALNSDLRNFVEGTQNIP